MGPYGWAASNEAVRQIVTDAQRDNLLQLTVNTPDNQPSKVIFDRKNGTPTLIKVKSFTPTLRTGQRRESALKSIENSARQFMAENSALLKIDDPDQEFKLIKSWSDYQGAAHFKYQQMVGNVPVFGKQLIVHADNQNSIYLLNGQYEPTPPALATTPTITQNEAVEAVGRHLGMTDISPTAVELSVFTKTDGEMVLTYKVDVAPSLSEAWTYFIDTDKGEFVHRISKIYNEIVSGNGTDLNGENRTFNAWRHTDGNYYLIDPGMPGEVEDDIEYAQDYIYYPGNTYIFSADNNIREEGAQFPYFSYINAPSPAGPWDPAGVSAMANLRTIHQYYHDTFNRNGWDDKYMNYLVFVHYGNSEDNAFFTRGNLKNVGVVGYLVFGDGYEEYSPLSESLDAVTHEFQHGITIYTAGLIYEKQSGALNEGYSDLFACMVDDDDWTMGEDIALQDPGYLRNLADPTLGYNRLPAKMSDYRDLPIDRDHGGVHINTTIPSHAGYLMAAGFDDGIGREATARIWYHALTTYLTPYSEFRHARVATIIAAEELYPNDPTIAAVVQRAWDQVEVLEDDTTKSDPGRGIAVNPEKLNFQDVSVGEQATQTLTLSNHSDEAIEIFGISLDGSADFSQDGTSRVLQSNGNMDIKVTYRPQKEGSASATLAVISNAYIPTNNVSITGRAVSDNSDNKDDGDSGGCLISTIGASGKPVTDGKIIFLLILGGILIGFYDSGLKWLIFCIDNFLER